MCALMGRSVEYLVGTPLNPADLYRARCDMASMCILASPAPPASGDVAPADADTLLRYLRLWWPARCTLRSRSAAASAAHAPTCRLACSCWTRKASGQCNRRVWMCVFVTQTQANWPVRPGAAGH